MAGTTQGDDLIILTDDVQTESPEMVINLDEDTTASKEEDMVLTFDESESDNKSEVSESVDSGSKDDAITSNDSDNEGLDFGDLVLDSNVGDANINEEKIEESKATKDSGDMLDFSSITEETSEENQEKETDVITKDSASDGGFMEDQLTDEASTDSSESNTVVGDMESILGDTIAKLETRQSVIHTEEEKQAGEITHLETQIKELESKKQEALEKKVDLEEEDKKIKSNITQLDKMKANTEVKTTQKAKK